MQTTILDSEAGFEGQLNLCCSNIDEYATILDLDAAKVTKERK